MERICFYLSSSRVQRNLAQGENDTFYYRCKHHNGVDVDDGGGGNGNGGGQDEDGYIAKCL